MNRYQEVEYVTVLEEGVKLMTPAHPWHYPAAALDDPKVQAKEEAEQKANIYEHDVCAGVIQVIKDLIVEAVNDYKVMGFNNKTTIEIFYHREKRGGALDYVDTNKI